ncbi:MAG: hypothetical protein IH955_03590, partial [Chloroflexi bacterium]|nr:hypothetical protein [Chloroflexota bacterium]
MSRFINWYVAELLRQMGWPRSKGMIFKKKYVDAQVLDVAVQQALQVAVGLGAGRPQLGVAVIADTFANNPWTKQSTVELLRDLLDR